MADEDWFPEWQRSSLRHRALCAFLGRLVPHEMVVFGGAAICVLDRARGKRRFDESFAAGGHNCKSFWIQKVHAESAADRLKLPRDLDIAASSLKCAERLWSSLALGAAGGDAPSAKFALTPKTPGSLYMHNPLFASFFKRRSFSAAVDEKLPCSSIHAGGRAIRERLLVDVVMPVSLDVGFTDAVAVSVYPNWMKHLSLVVDAGAVPPGRRRVLGDVPILDGCLAATLLLPAYAEEALVARGAWTSVEHLQRLAEARVTCGSLCFGWYMRKKLESLARHPLAAKTAEGWNAADTQRTRNRLFDTVLKELDDAWLSPRDTNLRPGGWRLRDETMLKLVVEKLQEGRPLRGALRDWCDARRKRTSNEVTILRVTKRDGPYSFVQFCNFDATEVRRAYSVAAANVLLHPSGLPIFPPRSVVLKLGDPLRMYRHITDDSSLPFLRALSGANDVWPEGSREYPLMLTSDDDWILGALTVDLKCDADEAGARDDAGVACDDAGDAGDDACDDACDDAVAFGWTVEDPVRA